MARKIETLYSRALTQRDMDKYFEVVNILEISHRATFNNLYDEIKNVKDTIASFSGNQVVGGLIGSRLNSGIYFVRFLGVDPRFEKNGVGTLTLNRAENFSREIDFDRIAFETHFRNVEWYQRRGYARFDEFQSLRSNDNRVILSKELV